MYSLVNSNMKIVIIIIIIIIIIISAESLNGKTKNHPPRNSFQETPPEG